MDLDTAFTLLRVFAGVVVAGHGAQKLFGWFGGQGQAGFAGMVRGMGFRPIPFWTKAAAWGEFAGGLTLAAGLLTGLAAGILVVDMVVAIWKVHWPRGFWIANGGSEYALANFVIFGLFGLTGAGPYSLDTALGLASWTMLLFALALVAGLTSVWASTRPDEIAIEERRHRAA